MQNNKSNLRVELVESLQILGAHPADRVGFIIIVVWPNQQIQILPDLSHKIFFDANRPKQIHRVRCVVVAKATGLLRCWGHNNGATSVSKFGHCYYSELYSRYFF